MKQLTCEMCGSADLIKQDGVFVCQTCGCKYSIEEARKMMVEGTVEVTGTVKVDNSAAIANYLKMAQSALEASNNKEAEDYANKIIELNPQNSEAWLIKGEAAGWQSSAANPRLTDAVTAWLNAIEHATDAERSALRETIADKYMRLMLAMVNLRCDNFKTIPDEERGNSIKMEVGNCVTLMNTLMTKGGVSFNRAFIYNQIADMLNKAVVAGHNEASKDFGDFGTNHSNMSKWQWERYTASGDSCLSILSYALNYVRDTSLGRTICDNLVSIGESVRDSCSWTFDVNSWSVDHHVREYSFTQGAKDSRTKSISGWKEKKSEFDYENKSKALSRVRGGRVEKEETAARVKYWEEHTGEKTALEDERASLQGRMKQLFGDLDTLPVLAEIQSVKTEISKLQKQRSGLGFFKGKEKKVLQGQIDEYQERLSQLEKQKQQDETPIHAQIDSAKRRISEIDGEFLKSRGRLSSDESHYVFTDAVKDGKFTITPNMVLECFNQIATAEFQTEIEASPVAAFPEFGQSWIITFKNPKADEEHQSVGGPIHLYAETLDSPISVIVFTAQRSVDSAVDLCREGARLLMAITSDDAMPEDELEEKLCDLIYSEDRSLFVYGDLRVEHAAFFIEMLGISIPFAFAVIRVND